ncbi:TPA: cytochrome P450 [Legionella anisa]|uniref:cytochrome P450 n=1 Tax=Legionella anisa TaxID=28082 RepID=UPI00197DF844|nr:cytochrome P450 [Legionella anisa]MBN5937673.1 cytochrome P450 [Legionella anisa]
MNYLSSGRTSMLFHRLPLKSLSYFHKAPIRFMAQVAHCHGDIAGFQCLNQRLWVIRQPDLADALVKHSCFAKSSLVFKQLIPITGRQGLVQLDDNDWKHRVPAIKPQFSIQGLNESLPLITANIDNVMQQCDQGLIDIHPIIMKLTMGNILALMGIEGVTDVSPIINDMLVLNQYCGQRMRQLLRLPLFLPLPSHRLIHKKASDLRSKLDLLVQTAKVRTGSPLHQLQLHWPRRECIDHLSTFLFAGFETTASSITTALHYLASNPEWQQAIYDESSDSAQLSVQSMRQWSWTQALYCETLRLYPPAYMLVRQPTVDVSLYHLNFRSNDLVILNVHGMQRHKKYWPNPKLFDIRRHLNRSPFANKAFMPFGLGKRICTGHQLAMTESMLILSAMCRRFRLSTPSSIKPIMNAEITLHPRSHIWLNCQPR